MLRNVLNSCTRSNALAYTQSQFSICVRFSVLADGLRSPYVVEFSFVSFWNVDECQRFTTELDGVDSLICLLDPAARRCARSQTPHVQGLEGELRHPRCSTLGVAER